MSAWQLWLLYHKSNQWTSGLKSRNARELGLDIWWRAISMKSLAAAGAARLEPHKSNYATIPRFLARPIGAWSSVRPTLPLRGMSGSRKSGEMPGSCTRPGASAMSRPPTARPRNLAGQEFGLALVTGLMPEGLRPLLFVWAAFRNERPEKCKSGIESSENT